MNELNDLLSKEFLGLTNLKWVVLFSSIVLLYFFRGVVVWACFKIKRSQNSFLDKSFMQFFFEQKIEKAISWIVICSGAFVVIEYLELPAAAAKYLVLLIKLFLTFNIIRICYMAAEAFGESMNEWAKSTENQIDDQLAPFASRTLKVMVLVIGSLIALQNFGVNVTALLAGLGIGGVALAFAAQDTVANVFGTITIILDHPFKLGDNIKIGDTEGIVEEVGFRSTRIRTGYNSVISIPNSVVAKERIDNLSQRNGWIRFRQVMSYAYESKISDLNKFSETLKTKLMQEESVDHTRVSVHLNSFGDYSMNVVIIFHYQLIDDESELQKINNFLELIYNTSTESNLTIASPPRTVVINK